jgi:hypothetical protein
MQSPIRTPACKLEKRSFKIATWRCNLTLPGLQRTGILNVNRTGLQIILNVPPVNNVGSTRQSHSTTTSNKCNAINYKLKPTGQCKQGPTGKYNKAGPTGQYNDTGPTRQYRRPALSWASPNNTQHVLAAGATNDRESKYII